MKAYIYHITNKINGKKYIGKTINFKHRQESHLSDLRLNKHHSHKLQRAYNKYGEENFVFDYYEVECADESELDYLEIKEIEKYDSYNSGYNETFGGEGHKVTFNYNQAVLIYYITKRYSGINRKIAKYFNCDHTVIDDIAKNVMYDGEAYSFDEYNELVKQLGLNEENLTENYVPHNIRKLDRDSCLELLSIITQKTGYDKIMCSIFGITNPTTTRLKKGLIYQEYISEYNNLTKEEQLKLCECTMKKYNLEQKKAIRSRASTKNALNQEQINYILDNKDRKTRTAIAKELGISADRVGSVILGKTYKDLVQNYYDCHG